MSAQLFNHPTAVVTGWYWLCRATQLRRGRVMALHLLGRELAVYRGADGKVVALDAYCAHMGAHLAEGRVEGNALRCFFHRWRYEADGHCSDIPCLDGKPPERACVRAWPTAEKHGLIWVWTGEQASQGVPEPPELTGSEYECYVANRFEKGCHPNVVLINAIDEQHFRSVHRLPGEILRMEPQVQSEANIEFRNTGRVPARHWFGRLIGRFYAGPLTYALSYWYGSMGFVTFGPDFLHLHLMFALRRSDDGRAIGQAVTFARRRRGPLGWLFNRILLRITALAARYFALGDTRVFNTIRFRLANPIAADHAVLAFIAHLEQQPHAGWNEPEPAPPDLPRLRVANRGK
ncbi:MAG: aromatic ring-hydroxylating dioxygenase subunit alpha [Gammaproteobacteria bacterium]|jgi:phenylpropionate dioxygenase-like ring-hydroxylating dioxygenase large terminal subunit